MTMLGLLTAAFTLAACYMFASPATALPSKHASAPEKLVFAHFMVGIVDDRTSASDYDLDFQRAKAIGVDAFALNIGTDSFTNTQLDLAYESADYNGMKVFISFDFNWYSSGDISAIASKIARYAAKPAQLKVDNKVFVSSFAGDGVNRIELEAAAGTKLFFIPNFTPGIGDFGHIDGAFSWRAWPNNGNNKAPAHDHNTSTSDEDRVYLQKLGTLSYLAPISPWFFTHYGSEVSYSKNFVFPGDLLWYNRWNEILSLAPPFTEIISWNDYGESHYVGPLSSSHYDDGSSKWTMDMPHDGWLDMAVPFIAAYKAGAKSTELKDFVTKDELVYWYRPTHKDIDCDSTDNTMESGNNASGNYFHGKPNGYETMADSVFIVSLLTEDSQIEAKSGNNYQAFHAKSGVNAFSLPMGIGSQSFTVKRNGASILSGTSARDIINTCPCGIYNFNAYVGQLPPPKVISQLRPDGLSKLTEGLRVACPVKTG
ncbi:glycoside hydrolase [Talaromyces proteolyticus]|uniref:Glycoside hydrolase n=1 Tax=Talaromyces proteolyticus TaxID=1131652 RepID=A0AAD4KPD6_9EURO|nr:glycoside hydrolase [Talaromyces proteolyticus]KAH8693738.1 glycoside hydrolase [Talaromyces proteolyticus]